MSTPDFIKNELATARRRYERLRQGAVARIAIYPTDDEFNARHTIAYLAIQRERCIEIVGGLDVLMALCRHVGEPNWLKECESLSGALWRLANGCDLAAAEIKCPVAFARRAA